LLNSVEELVVPAEVSTISNSVRERFLLEGLLLALGYREEVEDHQSAIEAKKDQEDVGHKILECRI
jgi:hypothetical protein